MTTVYTVRFSTEICSSYHWQCRRFFCVRVSTLFVLQACSLLSFATGNVSSPHDMQTQWQRALSGPDVCFWQFTQSQRGCRGQQMCTALGVRVFRGAEDPARTDRLRVGA